MTTLTIEIPDKSSKILIDLVDQLGGKIVETKADKQTKVKAYTKNYQSEEENSHRVNEDTTAYLNRSEANQKRLQKAIDEMNDGNYEEHNLIED